jgi:beta-N-acetylhexosaminidase
MTVKRWALLIAAGAALLCLSAAGIRISLAAEPQGRPGESGSHEAQRAEAARAGALAALRDESEAATELDRMIGQMILVGFLGSSQRDAGVIAVHDQLKRGTVGGVLLFPDNIRSPANLRALTTYLASANPTLAPFIAVDQEGGLVQRLSRRNGHAYFPAARKVARDSRLNSPEAAFDLYKRMADMLAKGGINLNFGPVVDLSINPGNSVVVRRKRSYGTDPKMVTMLAGAFIAAHRDANVITAAKHFPGHGSSWSDSHKSLPDITKSWREVELDPYVGLNRSGLLDMVMLGHLYHPRFSDGEKVPASLSERAVRALRTKGYIGFQGVIVSDDMEMGAVRGRFDLDDTVVRAVNAGVDVLVFSNVKARDPKLGDKVHAAIAEAVREGRIAPQTIRQAYERIALLKRRMMRHDLADTW